MKYRFIWKTRAEERIVGTWQLFKDWDHLGRMWKQFAPAGLEITKGEPEWVRNTQA